jgi:hypothetical protein
MVCVNVFFAMAHRAVMTGIVGTGRPDVNTVSPVTEFPHREMRRKA